jgi:hypothetical protein
MNINLNSSLATKNKANAMRIQAYCVVIPKDAVKIVHFTSAETT